MYPDLTQAFAPDSSQNGSGLPSPKEGYRVETGILPKDEVISELKFGEMYKDTCPNSDINSSGDQRCVTFSDKDRTLSRNSISKYSVEDTNTGVIDSGRVSTSPSSSGIIMGIDRSSPALTSSSPLPSYWSSVSETEIEGQLAQCRSFQPTPPVKHLVDGVVSKFLFDFLLCHPVQNKSDCIMILIFLLCLGTTHFKKLYSEAPKCSM